jgi:hypothetical protein
LIFLSKSTRLSKCPANDKKFFDSLTGLSTLPAHDYQIQVNKHIIFFFFFMMNQVHNIFEPGKRGLIK